MKESSILLQDLVLQSKKRPPLSTEEIESDILHQEGLRPKMKVIPRMNSSSVIYSSTLDYLDSNQMALDAVDEKVEDLIALGEEEVQPSDSKKKEKFIDRLALTTTAGIVQFGNLRKGSFLDRDLSSYSSQGETSVAYGIKLSYGLAEKISIRTGFSSINLGYQTDDVEISSAVAADAVDVGGLEYDYSFIGNLHQELGFFEIPVELSYVLVDKRIHLNLIGGASALFLNTNSLSLDNPESSVNLGAANNLNKISISGNIGLAMDYSFHRNLHLTLEPIFKYHFNTFRNPSSGIAPYMLGLYSGLTYKF